MSMTVDNPKYYTPSSPSPSSPSPSSPPPPLVPIATASADITSSSAHNDEQLMIWRNIASLFTRCDHNDDEIQKQREEYDTLNRVADDLYQETRDLKVRMGEVSTELSDELDLKLRQMKRKFRNYVSKKTENTHHSAATAAFDADLEVFKYIDTIREEFMETNMQLKDEIAELNATYYRDYEMFVRRENELMAKLDAAVKMNENTNERMKYLEDTFMRQIQQARNYADTQVAGNLREEFTKSICSELEYESEVNKKMVQAVNEQLTELITRSNEYHSARYFGTVEDVKQLRDTCQTLKQSIGMVDADLSDVKETVDHLNDQIGEVVSDVAGLEHDMKDQKEDIYNELDRDYYDLKDYVKRRVQWHVRNCHDERTPIMTTPPTMTEMVSNGTTFRKEDDSIVINFDDTCMISDEDEVKPE